MVYLAALHVIMVLYKLVEWFDHAHTHQFSLLCRCIHGSLSLGHSMQMVSMASRPQDVGSRKPWSTSHVYQVHGLIELCELRMPWHAPTLFVV